VTQSPSRTALASLTTQRCDPLGTSRSGGRRAPRARWTCPEGRDDFGARWVVGSRSSEPPEGPPGRGGGPSNRGRGGCSRVTRAVHGGVLVAISAAHEPHAGEPGVSHRHVDERGAIGRCGVRP
jgi:hypothetical protein